jgi:hypothetical protein
MSIIEKLTEGIVRRDMAKEGQALLDKWNATGLLEGLSNERQQHTMARLLENQAKELLRESTSMAAGDVEGFAAVAFPIVRRVFAGLIANDLVSVQPMSLPSGLIFFLDFVYSPDLGDGGLVHDDTANSGQGRLGNPSNKSIYGTDQVGSQVTGGVNLVGSDMTEDFGGPGRGGMTGYGYASPTSSVSLSDGASNLCYGNENPIFLDDNLSQAEKKLIKYDPDLLAISGAIAAGETDETSNAAVITLHANVDDFEKLDTNNLSAIAIKMGMFNASASVAGVDTSANFKQVRRLTQVFDKGQQIRFVLVGPKTQVTASSMTSGSKIGVAIEMEYPRIDNLTTGGAIGTVVGANEWGLEGSKEIPEIDIKVDSIAITAQTKKLKAKWTPELGQDLNAYHNLDAEVELTSILSEQIALEIDREILADLVNGATAGTFYWSRAPGLFVDRVNGNELGASSAAPDFTGTVSEWYETLIETINDVSAQIHRKTLRGGANFIVCGPEVANILEFTSGFRANVTADAERGDIGAVKAGSLNRKFDVIVDPYFPRQVILCGRRGNSFLESGYVYAPYVPLQTTPTIFGPEDFVPRKGVMTRYAKKMVRPDMYGLVIVRGLLGEEGASS